MSQEVIKKLEWGSTFKLVIFSIISLGIYVAYYIARQTKVLNEVLPEEKKINQALIKAIFIFAYVGIVSIVLVFFIPEENPLIKILDAVDRVFGFLLLYWSFVVRERMNKDLLESQKGSPTWFNGIATFFFSPFYINYKVNTLNENSRVITQNAQS
ncbi:MAG: DUF4234 domain-containing protein [Deltaproteobacteria bacterium]|nr:DUF4234 domain-containing protein [Deltaproteobacteria bacterium]